MKRLLPFLLLALLLTGCRDMYQEDYRFVQEHEAPFAYRETDQASPESNPPTEREMLPTVSRASDIREKIQSMVNNGEETGTFLLKNYDGIVDRDMRNMYNDLLDDSPKYIYALDDRLTWSLLEIDAGKAIRIKLKLRLTPKEVQAIPTLMFAPAMNEIYAAMLQQNSTYTVQISGYKETNFNALLEDYVLKHPNQIVEEPGISVSVFPNRGSVRVVELHFFYNTEKTVLSKRREDVNSFLELVNKQLSNEQSPEQALAPEEIVEILYKQLLPGIGYRNDPSATVYSLILQKTGGNCRTMASVAAYLCKGAGADCEIVVGTRDGESWYWNRIMTDTGWKYFDLHAAGLAQQYPALLPAAEMVGYCWDAEQYPEIESVEPEEAGGSTAPEPGVAPVEPESSAAPTEPGSAEAPAASTEHAESSESEEVTGPSDEVISSTEAR